MSAGSAKSRLRKEMGALRRAVGAEAAELAGHRMAELLLPELRRAGAAQLGLYAALPDELPTRSLFDAVVAAGIAVCLPRCVGDQLEFAAVERFEDLSPGRYGVAEPSTAARAVPLSNSDWVLVPGVAFGASGERLGRGGGYYDRALARVEEEGRGAPRWVGAGYEVQRVASLPVEPHDRRLDGLVTERALYWFGRG